MEEIKKLTFPSLVNDTVKKFGNSDAFAFVGEKPKTYTEVLNDINAVTAFLEELDVRPGDRVALLSSNMPNWGIAYFAITFMGAVVVPILPDFSPVEICNVLNHSEAKAVFVSSGLIQKIEDLEVESLKARILIDDFTIISSLVKSAGFNSSAKPVNVYNIEEDDLAAIIYTSGTTGKSKGVMLTHKNICFTAEGGKIIQPLDNTDRYLSVLPLSHTYENTLGLILCVLSGSCVYYLRKPPTPSVLIPALKEVRPTIMLTVPLIIEKIYFNKILPVFRDKFATRMLYKIPFVRKKLNAIAGKKLFDMFGGELKFFGIGGAKLNRTVEQFLIEAGFPYAIGYGLTETAPLLAGANPKYSVFESTGPAMNGVELMIHDPDKKTGEGEIWAKGPNVMKGYYKEPEMTREVITPDGWFRTGDLGTINGSNYLFIRGRLKNMIIGSSGENIYPEEIESVINNFRFVVESLVVQQKGKLVALVHLNMEELENKYAHLKEEVSKQFEEKVSKQIEEKIEEMIVELREYVNSRVSKFSQIQKIVIQSDPFQKTATLKIKRFLYT